MNSSDIQKRMKQVASDMMQDDKSHGDYKPYLVYRREYDNLVSHYGQDFVDNNCVIIRDNIPVD